MPPAVFADLGLAAARERAASERKLLFVDATAAWCGPCKLMDRTTWIDRDVVAWLQRHALAIQIDVDAQKDVAKQLRIEAMPTIIAFVDGTELDRVVGAKKPKELLVWLDGIMRGETAHVALERDVRDRPTDMQARVDLARQLTRAGRFDESLVEHVWLREHMLEHAPSMSGVRVSFFASDLAALVAAHGPARVAIGELRDRAAPAAAGPIDIDAFGDWKCLNTVLGEKHRTLAWYDALPETTRARLGRILEHYIIPLLLESKRWADAGALYDAPLKTLDRAAAMLSHDHPPDLIEHMRNHFRTSAAQLVRALCAANRDADASAVHAQACKIDPSAEMRNALTNPRP